MYGIEWSQNVGSGTFVIIKQSRIFLNCLSRRGDQVAANGIYLANKCLKFVQLVLRSCLSCGGDIFKNILQEVNYVSNFFLK